MLLSDQDIKAAIAARRIVIKPYEENFVQPSSIDVRIGNQFRVFHNYRYRVIEVKEQMDDLTELVEVPEGEPFILHPGEFALGSTFEWVQFPADIAGRLEGKALALDTEVPTPNGWATMGELVPGDTVFDETGAPTSIVASTRTMSGRACREVVFTDGTTVVTDVEHGWVASDKNSRAHHQGRLKLVTTGEMAQRLRGWGDGKELNYHVPLAGPVQYSVKSLPIDPYVLGIWLGDGTRTAAEITSADEFILEEIRSAGYDVHPATNRLAFRIGGTGHHRNPARDSLTGRYTGNGSISSLLRSLGQMEEKFLPRDYLESSILQRLALLQGLMDSDGYCDVYGRCEIVSTRETLANGYAELAGSLGLRPYICKDRATLNGIDCGPRYRVRFTPHFPVFRLPRKLERQVPKRWHHLFRAISDVREVESRPVKCIQVAGPSGQFLVTRRFIPTHNSSLGRLGLVTHSTAGFIDPSFEGHLTLELSNLANLAITIYPGMKIGQIAFFKLSSPSSNPYGSKDLKSKYQGQRGPTPSRYWENFRD